MRLSGRSDERAALIEAYAKAQGFFREKGTSWFAILTICYVGLQMLMV